VRSRYRHHERTGTFNNIHTETISIVAYNDNDNDSDHKTSRVIVKRYEVVVLVVLETTVHN